MTKFLVLYVSEKPAEQQMKVSPEEMKKGMEPWLAWFKKQGTGNYRSRKPYGKSGRNHSKRCSKSLH